MLTRDTKGGLASLLAVGIFLAASASFIAAESAPSVSPEGMALVKETGSRLVYVMPGASLEPYDKVLLIDCYVAFRKDWERDYNRSAAIGRRISDGDMARITSELSEEFRKVFSEELGSAGYEIVDYTGPDVVVIRPALLNLDVTAPDVNPASMTHTIIRTAGSMTLFLELYDSSSNAIFARVMDAKAGSRGGFAMQANSVTNKAEADRLLRSWATELIDRLDEARLRI